MPKVFLPQSPDSLSVNILPAAQFGDFVVCWQGHQLLTNTAWCIQQVRHAMKDATPHDYLLCIGDPSVIAICAIVFSQITGGRINILKWDRQEKEYYCVVIDVGEDYR